MSERDCDIEVALGAMQDALRAIADSSDGCLFDDGDPHRPQPCDCAHHRARRALRAGASWRYQGARTERLASGWNPREEALAEAWKRFCGRNHAGADRALALILDNDPNTRGINADISIRDWYVATSVVQWMATNVGSSLLAEAGYEYTRDDADRRLYEARRRARKYNRPVVKVASALILGDDDTMLMQLRKPTGLRPGMWEHPGGKVEGDEDLREALVREIDEELGVAIEVGPRLITVPLAVEIDLEVTLFHVTITAGTPKPLAAVEMRWVKPKDAIRHLACAPATYGFYEHVQLHMAALRALPAVVE